MSNNYFQFKQFRISQTASAMKVGTDGVLLGSWCDVSNSSSVLDIGCGTGLISLMIAQRNPHTSVLAIDISEDAISDCLLNFGASDWGNRLQAKLMPLQEFTLGSPNKFDLIVSNPPFFTQSLKGDQAHRNMARHDDSLSLIELFENASILLNTGGLFTVILPFERREEAIQKASLCSLFPCRELAVYPKLEDLKPKRVLLEFGLQLTDSSLGALFIERERHVYTDDYRELTKDFYLKF